MHESPETANPPLLLFHGLLSSPQEFGLIAHPLKMQGIDQRALSTIGYTAGSGETIFNWRAWRENASAAVSEQVSNQQPVILGGLCIGGMLAAAVALEKRHPIAGLVLISPTFTYDGWGMSLIRHWRHLGYWTGLDHFFSVAEREPFGVKNPKIRKWVRQELDQRALSAAGPTKVPLRALREAERMMANVRQRLGELDCPLLVIHSREDEITRIESVKQLFDDLPLRNKDLVIHSREDEITRIESVQQFFNDLPLRNKELVILENSYHMVTIDNDRRQVADQLSRFVKQLGARAVVAGANTVIADGHISSVAQTKETVINPIFNPC